jgi:type IV pilus assembly protein PilA
MFYKAMLKKKNSKKAFTLIELIVVIAIIGVLIAILVPTMSGFVDEARTTTDLANARTIYSVAAAQAAFLITQGGAVDATAVHDAAVPQLTGIDGTFVVNLDANGGVASVEFTPTGRDAVTYPQ